MFAVRYGPGRCRTRRSDPDWSAYYFGSDHRRLRAYDRRSGLSHVSRPHSGQARPLIAAGPTSRGLRIPGGVLRCGWACQHRPRRNAGAVLDFCPDSRPCHLPVLLIGSRSARPRRLGSCQTWRPDRFLLDRLGVNRSRPCQFRPPHRGDVCHQQSDRRRCPTPTSGRHPVPDGSCGPLLGPLGLTRPRPSGWPRTRCDPAPGRRRRACLIWTAGRHPCDLWAVRRGLDGRSRATAYSSKLLSRPASDAHDRAG